MGNINFLYKINLPVLQYMYILYLDAFTNFSRSFFIITRLQQFCPR